MQQSSGTQGRPWSFPRLVGSAFALVLSMATIGACTEAPEPPPSSQGIDGDALQRRSNARGNRGRNRWRVNSQTMDGTYNNWSRPEWGATFTQLKRMAIDDYADGVAEPSGADRQNPRAVSNILAHQGEYESKPNPFGASDFVWQWGQFLDHDLGLTDGNQEPAHIPVPAGDPWFDPQSTGTQIIPFSRSLYDPETGTDNPRQQENEITAWIDGSMVYGSSEERLFALWDPETGRLRTSEGDRLPYNEASLNNANGFVRDPTTLFLAGDVRANEQVGLAAMHTLFVREHNRLVDSYRGNADKRFRKARRMVIAQIQHITYTEFLPALIGPDALEPYCGYDWSIHPGLFNEFSVAAFRLGHSMVNEQLARFDASGNPAPGPLSLRESFFNAPTHLQKGSDLEPVLRGLAWQTHQRVDVHVVESLRNFLFGPPGSGGLDLVSLNIMRGRDHGVPSYNEMRMLMGLGRVESFADITPSPELQRKLEEAYGRVDLVDLWVGGLAEEPLYDEGSQVGPLFRAIVAYQFQALRDADRFWYERHLSRRELKTVRSRTLADVIRDNTGIGDELSDDVFHVP